jgi:integrase
MELPVSIKTPRLIRDRCGVYYFRLIVPLPLREVVGKTEFRRSLRTKDSAEARLRALSLSVAVEAMMVNPKFLTNPTLADFPHLLRPDAKQGTRDKIRIDLDKGIIETDTLEEAKEAQRITANMAKARHATAAAGIAAVLPVAKCGTTLTKAKDDFLAERKATLKDSTWRKHSGVLKAFIRTVGDLDVAMASVKVITDYKKGLLALGREATTVNDHITILNGFFDYCINNKVVNMVNPAKDLYIVGAHNKAESYETFTEEELQAIFRSPLYTEKLKLPDFYWCPLIALFTGARAEEIASLDLEQIYPVKGIWVIDILKGKNANAKRRVPVHDQLVALGLVDYVMGLRKVGYKKLFPHIKPGANGYRKNMTRMFGVYLDLPEVNIVDPLKVFHSFRHTVVTALTNAGVNDGLKRAMVGHDIDTRTSAHDDYIHASALTVPNLHAAINLLHFEGIDFSKLQLPKDVFFPVIAKRIAQQKTQNRKVAAKAPTKKAAKPATAPKAKAKTAAKR